MVEIAIAGDTVVKELLIGCGHRRTKDMGIRNDKEWHNLITLDNNEDCKPDVLWDLSQHPLPFKDNEFDEIHAYDVLEHLAQQGDYEFFFREFTEYWRILKHGGVFCASVPRWDRPWAWGDPSHKRVLCPESLVFLIQEQYEKQCGITKLSDFRNIYKANFKIVLAELGDMLFRFIIQAVKQ